MQLESTCRIGIRSHEQVLLTLIRRILHLLLKRRHEPDPRHHPRRNLRILQLKQQPHLPRQGIPRLRNLVARPSNLDHVPPHLHAHIHAQQVGVLRPAFLLLPRGPPGQVGLVLAALGVEHVGPIIFKKNEAEAAFEGADVVLEEVGVFVQVDGFEGEFAETLAAVGVGGGLGGYSAAAEFGAGAVLEGD